LARITYWGAKDIRTFETVIIALLDVAAVFLLVK